MRLYEYLIGGKKTGRIEDLKDPIPDSKSFRELKEGDTFFVSHFELDGTRVYADEIKITSIVKEHIRWAFNGLTKEGEKYAHLVWLEDLDKRLEVWDQRTRYKVFSTNNTAAEAIYNIEKKEIENSKK